jgi:hypothetical protein
MARKVRLAAGITAGARRGWPAPTQALRHASASTNTGARVHEFGRKPCPTMIGAQHRMPLGASEFGNTSLTGTTSWSR